MEPWSQRLTPTIHFNLAWALHPYLCVAKIPALSDLIQPTYEESFQTFGDCAASSVSWIMQSHFVEFWMSVSLKCQMRVFL